MALSINIYSLKVFVMKTLSVIGGLVKGIIPFAIFCVPFVLVSVTNDLHYYFGLVIALPLAVWLKGKI